MTCCTGDPASRRAFLTAALGAIATACAGPTVDAAAKREVDLHRQAAAALGPIVDPHSHPGAFTRVVTGGLPLAALDEMRRANVRCAFFAAVGDGAVIRREPGGIRNHRDPRPGELHRSTIGQLERVRARVREGATRLVTSRRDLSRRARDAPGARLAAVSAAGARATSGTSRTDLRPTPPA